MKKIEKNNGTYDDLYIIHIERCAIRTCSGLKCNVTHNDVYHLILRELYLRTLRACTALSWWNSALSIRDDLRVCVIQWRVF
jgi:hypothetical protein